MGEDGSESRHYLVRQNVADRSRPVAVKKGSILLKLIARVVVEGRCQRWLMLRVVWGYDQNRCDV